MADYVIGSKKGQAIAAQMSSGETYKASDGSTWTKNSDGSVSVSHNGKTTQNALPSNSYKGSATGVVANNASQQAGVNQLNSNSLQWYTADDATKATLHQQNQAIVDMLNSGGGNIAYDPTTGMWSGTAGKPATPITSIGGGGFSYNVAQPTFNSQYGTRIDQMLNQILNREDFTYDVTTDPLYQQYREQYNREGNRSMNDTLAAAASSAGGMNSYAITAAQQANDYYAAQLNDKIPELYQLAYEMYLTDIDNQVRDLGLLQQMDDTQYGRYRDQMSDWRNDRDFAYGMYRDDVTDEKWLNEFNEGNRQWQANFDQGFYTDLRDFNYGVSRDKVADEQWEKNYGINQGYLDLDRDKFASAEQEAAWDKAIAMLENQVMPSAELLEAAGMTAAEAQAIKDANVPVAPIGGGGDDAPRITGKGGDDDDDDDDDVYVPDFNNKPTGNNFIDKHAAAVKTAPDRTSFDTSDLSAGGKKALSSLSMMYDSMSNQYAGKDGLYPVEKTILGMAADGSITADDGYILMQHFGYNGDKHFPEG